MLADSSLQDMDDAMSDISIIDPEPESNSGSSDREALVETICRLVGVDDGTKRPLRVLVLGVHGVGKSSFINTIPAALNGEWHEFSYSGKPSGAQTVTVHLLRFAKCCLDNKDRFKTVLLPTLIDMPGLTDEADDKVEELLRLVLYGNIAEESAIGSIYEEIKNLNTEEIRKRYSTVYEDLKVDRVVFLASANEKFPERLMRCVLNAARPAHDMGLKRSIPVFGILTKKDKVVRSNPEFAEKEKCFKAGLGLTNHRYVICSNYCDETDELSGMKRGENPEINMPILNFLKDLCCPAVKVISSKEELSGMHKGKEDERNKDRHKQCIDEESERKQFPNKTSSSKRKRQRYYGMVERGTVLNECPKLEEEGLNEFLEETTTNSFLPPFISDSWQMTSEFSSKGGQMQEQNSDVVLYVPENAIESSSSVTIRTAVSTNLQRVHELFGLDSEEMIVSPVAEFTVKPNIPFKKSVWVILPHFLTQPYSSKHVNVYRFQNKILERLQFEPKDKRTAVSEGNQRDGFSVVKDGKICIFSSHFTGFFCTQCKRQLEPDQLYLRAYGQYTQRDKREVKLLLFVWDGRLHIKDFEKYILIGREKTYEVQKSGLLDAAPKDPKVCLGIEFLMQDNIRNFWNFTEMDGHQLFPPTTTRNLEYILCQKHLQKRARSKRDEEFPLCCYKREPLRIEWALDERPGCMPSKWFQCAIRVGYSTTFDPEPLNFLENARIETLHVNELEFKEARNSFSQTESCETHESRAARPSSIPSFNEGFQPSSLQTMIPLPHYTINNIRVNRLNGQVIAANENVQHSISATLLQDNMIDRVQKPILYRQYQAKKAHMERQNTGIQNERTLWHGTAGDAIHNINQHGFSRSYCGKNAFVHGQGVYFAVNSSYSADTTYSPPDSSGNRYMYQCKVLVGHSTLGNSNLRVLPARDKNILFDSVTNNLKTPDMYVIFHDTQAYPEYLITFK